MMSFKAIDHLCLDVADMERAKSFFIGQLGFAESGEEHIQEGIRTAFLQCGRVIIDLKCPVDGEVTPRQQAQGHVPGINHVALSTADIQQTYEELLANGVEFSREPTYQAHSDRWIAIFHDLDGNCFHLTM